MISNYVNRHRKIETTSCFLTFLDKALKLFSFILLSISYAAQPFFANNYLTEYLITMEFLQNFLDPDLIFNSHAVN